MSCFTFGWLENLLIWLVVIGAIIALVKLLVPIIVGPLGAAGSVIVQALNIVLWAVVAIAAIILIFELIACLLGTPMRLRP